MREILYVLICAILIVLCVWVAGYVTGAIP